MSHTSLQRPFALVDVFGATPYRGNGLAVVLDGQGLSDEAMLAFTRWTQLSEATFLLPPTQPQADYRVRIFFAGGELPFAGHPTLGSCHAWLAAGGRPRGAQVVQECGAGLVSIRQATPASKVAPGADDGTHTSRLAFAAPARRRSGLLDADELTRIVSALRIDPSRVKAHAWCDNGPAWRGLLLASAHEVLNLKPDLQALAGLKVGVVGAYGDATEREQAQADVEVRAFFPQGDSTGEDPVTGSLNAAMAQWLIEAGYAPAAYVAAQGTVLGRAGRVHITTDASKQVWVGGDVVTSVTGTVRM
jgi:PhzF family phenazine biosynthesis protein